MVDCYQCREENPTGKCRPAQEGPLFPFCCEEHKDKYSAAHFGKRPSVRKNRTIQEIQWIITHEWRNRNAKPKAVVSKVEYTEKVESNGDMFDVAKAIFG